MISFHTSHRLLAIVPASIFLLLSIAIAILPAIEQNTRYQPPPDARPIPSEVARGRALFQAEGCAYCHTMQVRSDTRLPMLEDGSYPPLAQDARYGAPSRPQDYVRDDPPFLGSERTGPDLMNIGERLPSADWHYTHLYDARFVVPSSVMPAYKWYFRGKADHQAGDRRVLLPDTAREAFGKGFEVWATPDAQAIIAYLLSLKPSTRAP